MRFIKSEAGHIEKLYYAVKAASLITSNDSARQRGLFLKLWNSAHPESNLTSVRSSESHLSFARELGLLTQRDKNRSWQVTNGFGRVFLVLYEQKKITPKNLLLACIMLNDRDLLTPYLSRILTRPLESHDKLFQEAYSDFFQQNRASLIKLEPVTPSKLELRTCRHHAEARDKFLTRSTGIGLNNGNLSIMLDWLKSTVLDDNLFAATSEILSGLRPTEASSSEVQQKLTEYLKFASTLGLASARGAWAYAAELDSPKHYVKWSMVLNTIQTVDRFVAQPSYDPKDRLYTLRRQVAGMQYV